MDRYAAASLGLPRCETDSNGRRRAKAGAMQLSHKCHERDYNAAGAADERCLSDDSTRAAGDARRPRAS
ncbi:hypothetical protein EMIT0111MI5_10178 [Burkholderia sp. IT-111MI5]